MPVLSVAAEPSRGPDAPEVTITLTPEKVQTATHLNTVLAPGNKRVPECPEKYLNHS